MTANNSTARTRRYRARLAERGDITITANVSGTTARLLRRLASEHRQPVAAVIQLGAMLVDRELKRPSRAA